MATRWAWERMSLSLAQVLSLVECCLSAMDLTGLTFFMLRVSLQLLSFLFSARGCLSRVWLQKLIFLGFSLVQVLILRLGSSRPALTFTFRFPIISTITIIFLNPTIHISLLLHTQNQNMMETAKPIPLKINYLKCTKNGLHQEESINLVCLEKGCLQNLVGCCACIEDSHKKHKTKPLKMVISQVREQKQLAPPVTINMDIMLDILKGHQQKTFEIFNSYKVSILQSLDQVQKTLQSYFDHSANQILLKNSDANILIEEVLERASSPKDQQELKLSLKKLVAFQIQQQGKNLSEEELKQSLQVLNGNLQKSIKTHFEESKSKISNLQGSLTNFMENSNLWQCNYKFSQKFKHNDIKLVTEKRVKAINSQGYKFSIMEPGVDKIGKKTFSFCVKESKSNWLGIGFCDKKTIQSKAYSFKFGSIGHGAYMISSNGGSWSNHKADQNNTIKGIKFGKNDIVHASLDNQTKKISFSKNNNAQVYQLPYQLVDNNQLHPCVLFYYSNDEVQFIGTNQK